MLYGIETGSVKEKDMIRLERNDARMARLMCNIWGQDFFRGTQDQTKTEKQEGILQDRRLPGFGLLERMEKSFWFSK